jgi:hydrogenase maturation protease
LLITYGNALDCAISRFAISNTENKSYKCCVANALKNNMIGLFYGMIKVIGIGNRLMMDDGIAIAILENLKINLESMGIEVLIGETDFQFCFHLLKEDDFVIILDAAYSGAAAGSVHLYKLQEAITAYGSTNTQHDMSVFDLMQLYSKPLKGYLIGIEIAEAEFGCELSEVLKVKFNGICVEVERIICEIVKEV